MENQIKMNGLFREIESFVHSVELNQDNQTVQYCVKALGEIMMKYQDSVQTVNK